MRRASPSRWTVAAPLVGVGLLAAAVAWSLVPPDLASPKVAALEMPRPRVTEGAGGAGGVAPEDEATNEDAPALPVGEVREQLDRRELEAGMAKVRPALHRCRGLGWSGTLEVRLTIAPSGGVTAATVLPTRAPGAGPAPQGPLFFDLVDGAARRKRGRVVVEESRPGDGPPVPEPVAECVVKVLKSHASFGRFRGALIPQMELIAPITLPD
jgi:hypothetical protein